MDPTVAMRTALTSAGQTQKPFIAQGEGVIVLADGTKMPADFYFGDRSTTGFYDPNKSYAATNPPPAPTPPPAPAPAPAEEAPVEEETLAEDTEEEAA